MKAKSKWKTNIKMLDINKYNSTVDCIKCKWTRHTIQKTEMRFKKREDIIHCPQDIYFLNIYILKLNASRG